MTVENGAKHPGMGAYVNEIVSMQFKGQVLLFKTALRAGGMITEALMDNQAPIATQSVENVKLVKLTDNQVFFEMKAPDGSTVECCLDRSLVAVIWRPLAPPSSILTV